MFAPCLHCFSFQPHSQIPFTWNRNLCLSYLESKNRQPCPVKPDLWDSMRAGRLSLSPRNRIVVLVWRWPKREGRAEQKRKICIFCLTLRIIGVCLSGWLLGHPTRLRLRLLDNKRSFPSKRKLLSYAFLWGKKGCCALY